LALCRVNQQSPEILDRLCVQINQEVESLVKLRDSLTDAGLLNQHAYLV